MLSRLSCVNVLLRLCPLHIALFACDRQYDCIVRRYTHDSPGRYTPRSLADAETNTRRARPIGTITVVGIIRKASDRVVKVASSQSPGRARDRQALTGNSNQQQNNSQHIPV